MKIFKKENNSSKTRVADSAIARSDSPRGGDSASSGDSDDSPRRDVEAVTESGTQQTSCTIFFASRNSASVEVGGCAFDSLSRRSNLPFTRDQFEAKDKRNSSSSKSLSCDNLNSRKVGSVAINNDLSAVNKRNKLFFSHNFRHVKNACVEDKKKNFILILKDVFDCNRGKRKIKKSNESNLNNNNNNNNTCSASIKQQTNNISSVEPESSLRKDVNNSQFSPNSHSSASADLRNPTTQERLTQLYHESLLLRFGPAQPPDRCCLRPKATTGGHRTSTEAIISGPAPVENLLQEETSLASTEPSSEAWDAPVGLLPQARDDRLVDLSSQDSQGQNEPTNTEDDTLFAESKIELDNEDSTTSSICIENSGIVPEDTVGNSIYLKKYPALFNENYLLNFINKNIQQFDQLNVSREVDNLVESKPLPRDSKEVLDAKLNLDFSYYENVSSNEYHHYNDDDDDDESEDEELTDDTSDSSVEYDLPPIDDKYFDLHYDPYYHTRYSLEDFPADQPIDYPPPYFVEGKQIALPNYLDSIFHEDWWQRFDGKPGRELYRSQSQPQNLGAQFRDDQPLDGNLPLHLFLSQSQPLGYDLTPKSNSLENLYSRKRRDLGSRCSSSFGSQLYTIKEEQEVDEVCEKYLSNVSNSESGSICDSFLSQTLPVSLVQKDFAKSKEEPASFVDEFFLFHSDVGGPKMKEMEKTNYPFNSSDNNFSYYSVQPRDSEIEEPDYILDSYSSENIQNNNEDRLENPKYSYKGNAMGECPDKTVDIQSESEYPVFSNQNLNKRLSRSTPDLASGCDEDSSFCNTFGSTPPTKRHLDTDNDTSQRKRSCQESFSVPRQAAFDSRGVQETFNFSSSDDEFDGCKSSSSRSLNNTLPNGLFCLDLSADIDGDGDKSYSQSYFTSGTPSFSAYSSDTSLDFDTFSKSSKVFNWNGSSSIPDLTSLSKKMSGEDPSLTSRGSSSTSDLASMTESNLNSDSHLGRTSYMQWSAHVKDDLDEDDHFLLPMNSSSFGFTPQSRKC